MKCQKLLVLWVALIMTYLRGSQFWKAIKQVLLEVEQKLSHRMAIPYPSKEFNIFLYWISWLFQELAPEDASMSKLHMGTFLISCFFSFYDVLEFPGALKFFWLHLVMFTDQVLVDDNLLSEVCVCWKIASSAIKKLKMLLGLLKNV